MLLEIIKEEGLLAPYRGWFPVISSLCCSNFVYFYTFNSLKAVWVKGQRSSTGKDLAIGFVAGVVNVLLTTPLWVVNTRLKLQGAKFRNEDIIPTNYKGIIDAFHQIIRDEGILALWNGTFPSLLLVFNPAIQFMFYEGLKRQLLKKRTKLSSLDVFIIGAVAKAIATTVTYPMQTVQSILRFGRHRLNPENRTLGSLRNVLSSSPTSQALWNNGTLQRPRGQAAPDSAHSRPHVPCVREADSCYLHRNGPEELT